MSLGVDAVGRAHRGDDGAPVLVGREELEPHRLRARARRAAEADVPLEHRVEAFLEQQAERDVERRDERDRRRERGVVLRLRLARALPVEVEARRASRSRRSAASETAHVPRPGGVISAFCEPETTTSSPQASVSQRHGAEARDGVDDDERSRLLRRGGERLDVGDDAGRRLGLDDPDRLRLALAQPRAHVVGVGRLAPGVAQMVDVGAVRPGHRGPALAEAARRDDEVRLAGRDEVLRRRTRTRPCRTT